MTVNGEVLDGSADGWAAAHPAARFRLAALGRAERVVKASGRVRVVSAGGVPMLAVADHWAVPDGYGGGDPGTSRTAPVGGQRGKVGEFSAASRRKLGMVLALMLQAMVSAPWCGMVTLTYGADGGPRDGVEAKRHLQAFREWLRREYGDHFGVWVGEWQRREAWHVHLALAGPCAVDRAAASAAWLRITGYGGSPVAAREAVGVHVGDHLGGDVLSYLAGEALKRGQKQLPDGIDGFGRWWGRINSALCKRAEAQADRLVLDLGADVVRRRLVDLDCVLRSHRSGVSVVDGDGVAHSLTWPARHVRGLAAQYLATGDPLDLVAVREAAWAQTGRRSADGERVGALVSAAG